MGRIGGERLIMSLHTYKCLSCGFIFDSIEKPGTKFAYCPKCKMIGKREGIELCSEPVLYGDGFYKQSQKVSPE